MRSPAKRGASRLGGKSKKAKPTADTCALCAGGHTDTPEDKALVATMRPQTRADLAALAVERGHGGLADIVSAQGSLRLHQQCRKAHTRPVAAAASRAAQRCPPSADRPPRTAAVDYKACCFFCSKRCDFDHLDTNRCHRVNLKTKDGARTLVADRIKSIMVQRRSARGGTDDWSSAVEAHLAGASSPCPCSPPPVLWCPSSPYPAHMFTLRCLLPRLPRRTVPRWSPRALTVRTPLPVPCR